MNRPKKDPLFIFLTLVFCLGFVFMGFERDKWKEKALDRGVKYIECMNAIEKHLDVVKPGWRGLKWNSER